MTDPLVAALTARRHQRQLSQTIVAGLAGITQTHLAQLELGRQAPRLPTLRAWVSALGMDLVLAPKPDIRVSQPGGIWPAP